MWCDCGGIILKTAHGADPWHLRPPDKGFDKGGVGTDHLCGVLPQGVEVSEISGAGMPGGSA